MSISCVIIVCVICTHDTHTHEKHLKILADTQSQPIAGLYPCVCVVARICQSSILMCFRKSEIARSLTSLTDLFALITTASCNNNVCACVCVRYAENTSSSVNIDVKQFQLKNQQQQQLP